MLILFPLPGSLLLILTSLVNPCSSCKVQAKCYFCDSFPLSGELTVLNISLYTTSLCMLILICFYLYLL